MGASQSAYPLEPGQHSRRALHGGMGAVAAGSSKWRGDSFDQRHPQFPRKGNPMKSMKMFCAAALVFGMGLGFSKPSQALHPKCEVDMTCLAECQANGGLNCYRGCCF
jgi:hypothetical protein